MRLDAVVSLRERDEDKARREMGEAQLQAKAAAEALEAAEAHARHDARKKGRAVDWELAEVAHVRALIDHRVAERAVTGATEKLGSTRKRYVGAHAKADALRRIVDARRVDQDREAATAEQKSLDEIAALLFGRH